MKQLLLALLSIIIANIILGQGVTRNGQVTNTVSTYVNRNGAIGISGLTKNGAVFSSVTNNYNNALDFNGGSDYVSLPSGVYFSGDFTIECWVYPKSFPNWARIIDFGNGAGSDNVLLSYTYGTSGAPGFYVEGSQFQANQTLPLNQWSHIAATLSGNTATIYINGVASGTSTFPTPVNIIRNKCYIGKSNWGDPGPNAIFDELRIWNTAKTQSQIQAAMYTELSGSETGLVDYYNFNQGVAGGINSSITSLSDKTSNLNNGTLNNFSLSGATSNWVAGASPLIYDGTSVQKASSSAYAIKEAYPSSTDGYYWIKNANINGGNPFQIYADMTTDGGGWTLIMCNTNSSGWTNSNAILLNETNPSNSSNYSIISWADYIKKSSAGFQYMIDANTRGNYGGIWTVNQPYSFISQSNNNTDITINTMFNGFTGYYDGGGVGPRMPWWTTNSSDGFITTSSSGTSFWWGTLIATGGWGPAPWLQNINPPGIIWYWVR